MDGDLLSEIVLSISGVVLLLALMLVVITAFAAPAAS